jgi:hypothetical protein
MNANLTIESLNGALVPNETPPVFSGKQTASQREAESVRDAISVWCSPRKFDALLETIIPILSLVYLIGAIGFGGLLLFYVLSR